MGWGLTSPQPTEESIIATAQAMAEVAEFAIIQQPVPWTRLFAGEELADLVAEMKGLADFLQALGLEIVFLVDPLDGLNRTAEPPELTDAGRSILEPEIRAIHEAYTLAIAREIGPAYFGLASEINTLGAHGDPLLYAELVDLINTLGPRIRAIEPSSQVFVSFQVDDAWNLFPFPEQIDQFALVDDFDIDALGLSSYPVFVWESPADIPDNYFSRFREVTDLPLILVEGGWSSENVGGLQGTSEVEQAEFFRRFEELMDGVDSPLWVFLIYADFDVASFGLPPDREATLSLFSFMGIVDSELRPKPAFDVWDEIFARPLIP
jgi:hypothetical protein